MVCCSQTPSSAAEAQLKGWALVNKVAVEEAAIKVLEEEMDFKIKETQAKLIREADLLTRSGSRIEHPHTQERYAAAKKMVLCKLWGRAVHRGRLHTGEST